MSFYDEEGGAGVLSRSEVAQTFHFHSMTLKKEALDLIERILKR
jgi:hypothetical protein